MHGEMRTKRRQKTHFLISVEIGSIGIVSPYITFVFGLMPSFE